MKRCLKQTYGVRGGIRLGKHLFRHQVMQRMLIKTVSTGLQARGVNALGLTGADMNVIRSVKRPVK